MKPEIIREWPEGWTDEQINPFIAKMDEFGFAGDDVFKSIAWDVERNEATLQDMVNYFLECGRLGQRAAVLYQADQRAYVWFSCLMSDLSPKARSGWPTKLLMVIVMAVAGVVIWLPYRICRWWLQWRSSVVQADMSPTFTDYMCRLKGVTPSVPTVCDCDEKK